MGVPRGSSFSRFSLVLIKLRAVNIRGYMALLTDSKPSSPSNEPIPQASFDDNGTPHLQVVISSLIPQLLSQFPAPLTINNNCNFFTLVKSFNLHSNHHLVKLTEIRIQVINLRLQFRMWKSIGKWPVLRGYSYKKEIKKRFIKIYITFFLI